MNTVQAKAIPINRLLSHLGFNPAFERKGELWYASPFRPDETEPSFHISPSRRAWKDFGNGERGGNILDFVMQFYNLGANLTAALKELERIEEAQPGFFTGGLSVGFGSVTTRPPARSGRRSRRRGRDTRLQSEAGRFILG